jgi:hypothetical protein
MGFGRGESSISQGKRLFPEPKRSFPERNEQLLAGKTLFPDAKGLLSGAEGFLVQDVKDQEGEARGLELLGHPLVNASS